MRLPLALALTLVAACSDSGEILSPGHRATGPPPTARTTLAFDDAPLVGDLFLDLPDDSSGWEYEVDLDGDDRPEHEGSLDRPIAFAYRFDVPGVHRIAVRFFGSDTIVVRELPLVVNDTSPLQILNSTSLPEGPHYEGLAIDPSAESLFIGGWADGSLRHVDAGTLEVVRRIQYVRRLLAGLSVAPSGRFLFSAVQDLGGGTGRLEIPGLLPLELRSNPYRHTYYTVALDDERALSSGIDGGLVVAHLPGGKLLATLEEHDRGGYPAVSPDGTRVAVAGSPTGLFLASLPDLKLLAEYDLPQSSTATPAAFGPTGERIYLLSPGQLLVVEAATGEILRDMVVSRGCPCTPNPVTTSADGRFVIFGTGEGALFVDTRLDLPLHRLPIDEVAGISVVASPVENAVFVLEPWGSLRKVRIPSD